MSIMSDTESTRARNKVSPAMRRRARDNWIFTGALKRTPIAQRVRLLEAIDRAVEADRTRREIAIEIARLPCNRPPKR